MTNELIPTFLGQRMEIVSVLQTALAPAFLLVALGNMLNLFSGRLTRIVDRTRHLEGLYPKTTGIEHDRLVNELRILERRLVIVGRSIFCGVLGAIAVCITIGLLFWNGLTDHSAEWAISPAFMVALGLLGTSLLLFVREVQLASKLIHVRQEYLELEEESAKSD